MKFNHYKIKAARCLKGYSAEELSRRANMDLHAYWRIESGKTQLKVQHFLKIASALGQPLSYFVEENEATTEIASRVNDLLLMTARLDEQEKQPYTALIQSLEAVQVSESHE